MKFLNENTELLKEDSTADTNAIKYIEDLYANWYYDYEGSFDELIDAFEDGKMGIDYTSELPTRFQGEPYNHFIEYLEIVNAIGLDLFNINE